MKHNKWTCLESKVTLQFMGKIKQKKRKKPSKNPWVLPPPKNKLQQLLLLVSSCDSRLPLFSLLLTNKNQTKPPSPLLFLRSLSFSFQCSDSCPSLRENHIFLMPFPSSPSSSSPFFSLSIKWPKIHISCISFL